MAETKRVAVLAESYFEMARGMFRGIGNYQSGKGAWRLFQGPSSTPLKQLKFWKVEGIIGYLRPDQIEELSTLGVPIVICGSQIPPERASRHTRVMPDWDQIAAMTVEHMAERGLTNVAYVASETHPIGPTRQDCLRAAVVAQQPRMRYCGELALKFIPDETRELDERSACIRNWLSALPRPVGIATFYDPFGMEIVEACRDLGLSVPEDVAVLGCDDDEAYCLLSNPPLSSINLDGERIGMRAAEVLDDIFAGRTTPGRVERVPPHGVTVRTSTEVCGFSDEDFAAALKNLRANAHKMVKVGDLLKSAGLSRRALEVKFQRYLNRSPLQELQRIRLERAMALLRTTNTKIAHIARQSGFASENRFFAAFRKANGVTPLQYREQHRR